MGNYEQEYYRIVRITFESQSEINKMIEEGWEPLGSPFARSLGMTIAQEVFYQAMWNKKKLKIREISK